MVATASRALAAARPWLAEPWPRPAAPRPWLAEPPHSTHEVHYDLLDNSYLVICSSDKMVIPLFTKFTHVTYTYETI
jgi:hypothetical protein